MKILFAIKRMDDAAGGAERVLACIASAFAARGHDVVLISFDPPGGQSFYPLDPGIRRITLGIGNVRDHAHVGETFSRMRALRRTVPPEKPDIAIGFMHSMFVPLAFALKGSGIPVIASEHIVPHHYRDRRLEFILFCAAVGLVRQITVTTAAVRALYPRFMRKKIIPIANPISLQAVQAAPGTDVPVRTILNVGRLDPQKGQQILIESFARLAGRYPDWHLRIVGEGELRTSLESAIERLHLTGRVTLVNNHADIANDYAQAQIFAMPSLYESFGLATAEAMTSGLPVVGFADCPGTSELIRDGENGFLVKNPDRVAGLAETLERLMVDPALRTQLGMRGREVAQAYKPDTIIDQWEMLIKKWSMHNV